MFNPITGELSDTGVIRTGSKIKQVMLLPKANDEFLREVLVLDENDAVTVYPNGKSGVVSDGVKQMFLFTADEESGVLMGYSLGYSTTEVI